MCLNCCALLLLLLLPHTLIPNHSVVFCCCSAATPFPPCQQVFQLLDMHTQVSLSLPHLSRMLTPPQPPPTSRRSSAAGSATGSMSNISSSGPAAAAAAAGGGGGVSGGTALVDGLWELQQLVASAARGLLGEYEELIARDGNKMLPMDGTIHPLTAQVLSYVKVGWVAQDSYPQCLVMWVFCVSCYYCLWPHQSCSTAPAF